MYNVGVKKGDILCSFDGLPLDNYGEIYIKTLDIKFHIFDYLKYKTIGEQIEIIIIRENENKKINKKITLLPNTFYKTRYKYPLYENIEYIIIGGMIIMELTNNHLDIEEISENSIINKYDKIDKKINNKLIITKILKGSSLAEYNIFSAPNILKEINNIEVNNMYELKKNIVKMKENNQKKYISFLTENDKYFLLEQEESKKEELFLSKELGYKITDFIKSLLNIK